MATLEDRLASWITALGADIKTLMTRAQVVVFSVQGTLTVSSYSFRWYPPRSVTISSVRISVGTAPTGATVIVDVNKNGTTIFTTQANRPAVAISGNTAVSGTPDVTSLTSTDYLTIDVDQIGSTVAGANLTVEVSYS